MPPVLPMLAKRVDETPAGEEWVFEPKWDGFRALVIRDGDEIEIQSRDTKSLNRYFPELVEVLLRQLPERCVLDGEIVIAGRGGLDFEALQLRVHPAASRVKMLSETTPASVVFFDLLCVGDEDLREVGFALRRLRLGEVLAGAVAPVHVTPATAEREVASDWFKRFEGAGLDGVMAKAAGSVYAPDKRTMLKIKHERDCDCVVAGFRWHKDSDGTAVGSLLLGLYDDAGALQHVGVCASFTAAKRKDLVGFLGAVQNGCFEGASVGRGGRRAWLKGGCRVGRAAGRGGKDLSWEAVRPELVVEVAYEHMQGNRFRHLAHFRRWREDKRPEDCTYAQLEVVAPQELGEIFVGGR